MQQSGIGKALEKRLEEKIVKDRNEQTIKTIENIYYFVLQDTLGEDVSLNAWNGKYLLVDFWASWCTPCIENIPQMKLLEKKYSSDTFQIISISLDEYERSWKQAIQRFSPPGVHVSATKAFNSTIALFYQVKSLPHYMLIGKDGTIINNIPRSGLDEIIVTVEKVIRKE